MAAVDLVDPGVWTSQARRRWRAAVALDRFVA